MQFILITYNVKHNRSKKSEPQKLIFRTMFISLFYCRFMQCYVHFFNYHLIKTMLRRIGNKKKIASEIIKYFPKDITVFIDLFFGTGAMTWEMLNKYPKLYCFANDLDNDISNLWYIMQNERDFNQLYEAIELCPYHADIYKYFKNDYLPKNNIEQALQFLYLSNYSLFGFKSELRQVAYNNSKEILINEMKNILKYLSNVKFENKDVFKIQIPLSFPENRPLQKYGQFVYCDPPYIATADNYQNSFTEEQNRKLIEKLIASELRFAISEFKSEITEQIAKDYNLYYTEIKERRNHKKRSTEILMTNYKPDYQKQIKRTLWDGFN